MVENNFELILCIVDNGFSDLAMDAARDAGARGGTVVHARGTGRKDMEEKYGVVVTPEKELVLILVSNSIRDAVLDAIYKAAGLNTKGHGIAFSLPVSDVSGLKFEK